MKSLSKFNADDQELSELDPSLKKLVTEAQSLFTVLDTASAKIRKLESNLSNLKAHFPFRYQIKEEKKSFPKDMEAKHRDVCQLGHHYFTIVYWYLSWEADENSKNFRLCLISEEKEVIEYLVEEDIYDGIDFQSKCLFKKPLIETDLSTRLQYLEHLIPFINAFTDFLKKYRISIEWGDDLPF